VSRTRLVPPGHFGGLDASHIPQSQGRGGLLLHVPAVVDGQRCHEDETYTFEVVLNHNAAGKLFAVRCAGCNYLHEFPHDPGNPQWTAGYIHQALVEHVANFVRWRLGGGELTWAQRQGVPPVEGEPCSASLATWMAEHSNMNRTLDTGPREGWWVPGAAVAGGPVAQAGVKWSGPVATAGRVAGMAQAGGDEADLLRRPAAALRVMVTLNLLVAGMSLLNILVTLYMFRFDRMFAIATNILFILVALGVGGAAWFGVRQYREGRGKVLPWVAIVYSGMVPICCLGGVPVAVWAGIRWMDPRVRALRQ